jgi:hypothetical protein
MNRASAHVSCARELLARHGLTVPDSTTEMIAKTIAKRYKLGSRQKKELSPRERLRKAHTHAVKLLEYTERGTKDSRLCASISTRSASLFGALNDLGVVIRLATATSLDVVGILGRLESGGLSKDELTRLIPALRSALPASGRPGRPREDTAHVLRGACIAWLRAGRAQKYTWDEVSGRLKGPLAAFARDLLDCCQLEAPSDNALYCTIRVALRDCQGAIRRIG